MVRYHSLVIDAESLPKELIPIAWTSSSDALSFLETQQSNTTSDAYESHIKCRRSTESFSEVKNGTCWPSVQSDKSRRVLMGIMHSCRPHYGVQVCHMVILSNICNCSDLLCWVLHFWIFFWRAVSSRKCCYISWEANIQEL